MQKNFYKKAQISIYAVFYINMGNKVQKTCEWDILLHLWEMKQNNIFDAEALRDFDNLIQTLTMFYEIHDDAYGTNYLELFEEIYVKRRLNFSQISSVCHTTYRTVINVRKKICHTAEKHIKKTNIHLVDYLKTI